MHCPMACCSAELGCLLANSSYNCCPNTPIRQPLIVGSLVVNGLSNPDPGPGSEVSGGSVVLTGRVVLVGRVGVVRSAADVVVAGTSVVDVLVAGAAVVLPVFTVGVAAVVVEATADVGAAVVSGVTVAEPPPQAAASTARVRRTAVARIDQVWHEACCVGGAMP
ncbi:MAG: hypothetical protein ISR43_08870 [Acidimicrobiia bacterium]|nr:hypothetical protein [Acidimicrobiia bacterium]